MGLHQGVWEARCAQNEEDTGCSSWSSGPKLSSARLLRSGTGGLCTFMVIVMLYLNCTCHLQVNAVIEACRALLDLEAHGIGFTTSRDGLTVRKRSARPDSREVNSFQMQKT